MTVKWVIGFTFDMWNNLRYAAHEAGKAIDRAMDVFPE